MPHPLYQRLKELDPTTFEQFCFHLLTARHPGVTILRIEGTGGDEGIDSFEGNLDDGPSIWQCKSFPNGVRQSQRAQIKASLRRALERCAPKHWILCLSIDLDAPAHRWFQRLQQSYADRVQMVVLQIYISFASPAIRCSTEGASALIRSRNTFA
jgi:hypothetical protein